MRVDNDLGQPMCERKKEKCVLSPGYLQSQPMAKYNVYYTGDFYTCISRLMVLDIDIKIMQAATIYVCTLHFTK